MDCPTCGYTLAPLETKCSRCQRIAQEEFKRSPAAVWPPAIGPAALGPAVVETAPKPLPPLSSYTEDTSEQNSSGEERGCPLEIAELHWNWGAFFCGWLWCFLNALPGLAVLILGVAVLFVFLTVTLLPAGYAIPSELLALVLFGLHCHLGIHGHQLAWEHRRFFGGTGQYFAVQRAWLVSGAIAFGLTAFLMTFSTVAFFKAFNAYEARRQHPATLPPPVTASAPAPIILHAAPAGGTGFHRPWSRPGRVRYRPGYGPGDIRTSPDGQTYPETPQPVNAQPAPAPQFPPSPGFSNTGTPNANTGIPNNTPQTDGSQSDSAQAAASPSQPASAASATPSTGANPPSGVAAP